MQVECLGLTPNAVLHCCALYLINSRLALLAALTCVCHEHLFCHFKEFLLIPSHLLKFVPFFFWIAFSFTHPGFNTCSAGSRSHWLS